MRLSVVIPFFNERESLPVLRDELAGAADRAEAVPCEFIFVDDGSDDGSWAVIADLARRDPRVRGLRLDRRRGKSAALAAGFAAAAGDWIVTLDADLQDDPAEIPLLLGALAAGVGLVVGWRRSRRDAGTKRMSSAVFNGVVSAVSGVRLHDHNCGLKLMRRELAAVLWLDRGMHRYIPAMAHAAGFGVAEIEVHHRRRRFGRSKYGWSRPFRAAFDLIRLGVRTRWFSRPAKRDIETAGHGAAQVRETVGFAAPTEARS